MSNQNALEPMQVDIQMEDNDNYEDEHDHVVDNSSLDLEAYANNYTGLARIYRLMFIADHCSSLRVEALKMAINNIMQTYNVALYQTLYKKLVDVTASTNVLPDVAGGGRVGHDLLPQLDQTWIDTRNKKAALKLEKLDTDLKNYKSNSIKESIRRGHDDLGDHYLDCGDLNNALKCYSRARDYCTSGKHIVNMCINVIKVSIYLQNWTHVSSYVCKAEQTPDFVEGKENNNAIFTRLRCAAGIAELACRRYKSAARNFLQASFDHCDFPEVLSPSNVAVYGGLCALATYDRNELQKNVMTSSFKQFLELEPQLRDIIFKFHESQYATCLRLLDEIKDNLYLDMYIAPHVPSLYSQIRNRALIQYFSPYLSADMRKMAAAFNTSVHSLEDELIQLILDGQIQARIDSHNQILYAKDVDQRSTTFKKSIAMGKQYARNSHMLILRAAVIKHHIQVKLRSVTMSSWKKASKVNQKTHRERQQLRSRSHLGFLEKHKDYKARANVENNRNLLIKSLKKRALNKNPDEFYFNMVNSKVVDDVHHAKRKEVKHTAEQLKLMQTRDLKYVNSRRTMEAKKIDKLKSQLHFIDKADATPNTHLFYVDDEEAKDFDLCRRLNTHPSLVNRRSNRPRLEDLEKYSFPDLDEASAKRANSKKMKMYRELEQRMDRERTLGVVQRKLEVKRELTRNNRGVKKVAPATPNSAPVYKWKQERKK